jgi:glutamyl-tRNA synthetase
MKQLESQRRIFACELTRSQIEAAASAPHLHEHETAFPISLRPADSSAFAFARDECNYRFLVEPAVTQVVDEIAGTHEIDVSRDIGDFVVWTKRGAPSYQLAVVVDDARQQVTDVVRGDDLLASAARQTLLYRALNLPVPRWWHLPLVLGPDGHRLAKRHGDTRIDTYRAAGVPPGHIIALLARWCGIEDPGLTMSAEDFRQALDLKRLPREPVRFSEDDDRWLRRT